MSHVPSLSILKPGTICNSVRFGARKARFSRPDNFVFGQSGAVQQLGDRVTTQSGAELVDSSPRCCSGN